MGRGPGSVPATFARFASTFQELPNENWGHRRASEQEEEAREFSLSKHSGAFRSGSIFQCFPGAMSTELMTSIGKPTPHLAVFDPGIPIYNWRGNERGIMQLFFATGAILTP